MIEIEYDQRKQHDTLTPLTTDLAIGHTTNVCCNGLVLERRLHMYRTRLKLMVVLLLVTVLGAPPCWAKEKGYCYVVSYSLREKVAFFTPVFTAVVSGAVYSDEEFVADVEVIRNIENQFKAYQEKIGLNSADYYTEARVSYRSEQAADQRMAAEKKRYEGRGFAIKKTGSFEYAE